MKYWPRGASVSASAAGFAGASSPPLPARRIRRIAEQGAPDTQKLRGGGGGENDFDPAVASKCAVLAGEAATLEIHQPGRAGSGAKHALHAAQPALIGLQDPGEPRLQDGAREHNSRGSIHCTAQYPSACSWVSVPIRPPMSNAHDTGRAADSGLGTSEKRGARSNLRSAASGNSP